VATNLQFDVSALDRASSTFVKMAAQVERLAAKIDKLDGKKADVDIDVDTAKAEAEIGAFARDTRAKLEAAFRALPELKIDADSSDADRAIAAVRARMQELSDKKIGVDIDAAAAIAEAKALQRELDSIGRGSKSVQVKADTAEAAAKLGAIIAEADRIDGRRATVKVSVDRSLSDALIHLRQLGQALHAIALPAAAIAAAPQLAAIGQAAVTAAGSTGLLPAILTTAAAGFGALKIAASGFGDALKASGDPAKFAEALKGLAPSAQAAAKAIASLQPAFNSMRLDLQQKLFADLGTSIKSLGATYIPVLQQSFGGIATAANSAMRGIADLLAETNRVTDITQLGLSISTVFDNLSGAVKPLVGAFLDIATVGARSLAALTTGAQSAAEQFAQFVARARQSGDLRQWIDQGVQALKDLGAIAVNVGSTLAGIFKAATSSGGDFLGTVRNLTTEIRNFVNSAQGQTAIANVFSTIKQTVEAALPGVKTLATAIGDVVNKIADSQLGQKIGAAFSQIAQVVGPIVSTLGSIAVSVIGPLVQAFGALAPVLGPVATGLLGVWAAAKLMTGINAIAGFVSSFVTSLRNLGTAVSGGGLMGALRGLASTLGVGGVLGIALAGAGIALGIFSQLQSNAAQKAQEHKAALDALAGTLDKYSGAVTQATINEKASQLAKDGTLEKVKQLGVSTEDYVRATLGMPGALERVNTQLTAHTAAIIGASDQYQKWGPKLQSIGLSLDDIAAAASGNAPAMEKVQKALAGINNETDKTTFGHVINDLLGMGEESAKLARELGITTDEFKKVQEQTRLAGEASNDFAAKLDFLRQGLAGLKDGAAPTKEFAAGLSGLATSAGEAATRAGEAAKALNGVGAGAAAAEKSMSESRQAFVDAATAAGLSAEQANALADSIGLIPAAAKVNFETNATGATAEVNTFKFQLDAVPGQKQVTVNALTSDAQALVEALGFKVERLPNGQVTITANTETAKAALDAFVAGQQNRSATVNINGNTVPAATALQTVLAAIQSGQGTVTINGQSVPAQVALAGILGQISAGQGTVTINGQSVPAAEALAAYLSAVNSSSGTATINGNSVPAADILAAFLSRTDSSTGTVKVNADAAAANAAIDNAARPRTAVISVVIKQSSAAVRVAGQQEFAGGGVAGYSGGGVVRPRVRAASGLVLSGYAPGRDTVPALLSRGEAVLVPELVRALGASRILAANAEASGGRPAANVGSLAGLMDGLIPQPRGASGPGSGWAPRPSGSAVNIDLGSLASRIDALRAEVSDLRADAAGYAAADRATARNTAALVNEAQRSRPGAAAVAAGARSLADVGLFG